MDSRFRGNDDFGALGSKEVTGERDLVAGLGPLLVDPGVGHVRQHLAPDQALDAARFQQSGTPALLACTIRGRTGSTRALCRGKKSYRTTHTFRNTADKKQFWRREDRRGFWNREV